MPVSFQFLDKDRKAIPLTMIKKACQTWASAAPEGEDRKGDWYTVIEWEAIAAGNENSTVEQRIKYYAIDKGHDAMVSLLETLKTQTGLQSFLSNRRYCAEHSS